MRRHVLGIVALLLLAVSVGFWVWVPGDEYQIVWSVVRIGTVLAALWLAYDELLRLPVWLWVAVPVVVAAIIFHAKWLLLAVPVVVILAILRPRSRTPK
jgi:hypothetical protein